MSSSDISMVPESTLPDTSSEVRERELERLERLERPVVQVPATQAVPVTVGLEDQVHDIREEVHDIREEVHDIRDDIRRLETRFDGLEERMDESDRRIDGRFDTIKEWTDGMKEWTVGVAETLRTIQAQLAEIKRGARPGGGGRSRGTDSIE